MIVVARGQPDTHLCRRFRYPTLLISAPPPLEYTVDSAQGNIQVLTLLADKTHFAASWEYAWECIFFAAEHQGTAHDENGGREKYQKLRQLRSRRTIENERLRDVQCRSPVLPVHMLERRLVWQGKYEEEKESKFSGPVEAVLYMHAAGTAHRPAPGP